MQYKYYWLYACEFVNQVLDMYILKNFPYRHQAWLPAQQASLIPVKKVITIANCKSCSSYPDILIIIDPV